ncbi:hypothetical protein [Flavobacterium sp.]|jgi:hypothetical protein|uniref:hypothetical protein n=1 Tax=Flavobacterium sp. TaxID=239 RepID=UPI0037C0E3AD
MKLTKDDIVFIDTYLIKNEVIYVDIRLEVLDHIALAVEQKMEVDNQDFYDAFKDFMVQHKKEILRNNKTHSGFNLHAAQNFLLFLIKPYWLVFVVVLFLFFKYVKVNSYFSQNFTFGNLIFVMIASIALFQFVYFYVYLKKRFYSIEKSGAVLAIIYFAQIFFLPIVGKENVPTITITIFSFLLFGYVVFFIKEIIKFNKHQFNYI